MQLRSCGLIVQDLSIRHCSSPRINALPQNLAEVDSGAVLYVNLAWAQMFEYADPSQIGGRLDDFTPLSHYCHGGTVPEGLQLGFARSTPGKSDVGFGG
jgi:PAS domain-containing protein